MFSGPVFWGVKALTIWSHMVEGQHSVARCDLFANYFASKSDCIYSELDSGLNVQNLDVRHIHLVPFYRIAFSLCNPRL